MSRGFKGVSPLFDYELTLDYLNNLPKIHDKFFNFTPYKICHSKRKIISCSIFKRSTEGVYGVSPYNDEFETKYLNKFFNLMKYIKKHFPTFGVMLFTTDDLAHLFKNENINIYTNPYNEGLIHTFSRFLAIDYDIDLMMVIDVDETHLRHHKLFDDRSSRFLIVGKYDYFVNPEKTAKKYSAIMAGGFQLCKKDITFKMQDIIPRFLYHQTHNLHLEPKTIYNAKSNEEHYLGFGNRPFTYGCDERFLTKFLYFYLTRKGVLTTYTNNPKNEENIMDFCFLKQVRGHPVNPLDQNWNPIKIIIA